jgi:putative DNA primase/helicase
LKHHYIKFKDGEKGKSGGAYYQYCNNNYWKPISEYDVKLALKNFLHEHEPNIWKISLRNECFEILSLESPPAEKNNDKYINVKNGLLNLETFKLEKHNKNIFCTVQIPVNYKKDAVCLSSGLT